MRSCINHAWLSQPLSVLMDRTSHGQLLLAGAVYQNEGSGKLTGNSLSNNTAGTNGGGVYQQSHNGDVTRTTFSGNFAQSNAGGMYQNQATSNVQTCTFEDNTGGGLYRNTCNGKISGTKLNYNQSKQGGGIYQVTPSHVAEMPGQLCPGQLCPGQSSGLSETPRDAHDTGAYSMQQRCLISVVTGLTPHIQC